MAEEEVTAEEEISAMTEEDEVPGVIAEEMPGATEEEERSVMTEDEELASSAVAEESGCVSGALEVLSEQEVSPAMPRAHANGAMRASSLSMANPRGLRAGLLR